MKKYVCLDGIKDGQFYFVNPDLVRFISEIESQKGRCTVHFDDDHYIVIKWAADVVIGMLNNPDQYHGTR